MRRQIDRALRLTPPRSRATPTPAPNPPAPLPRAIAGRPISAPRCCPRCDPRPHRAAAFSGGTGRGIRRSSRAAIRCTWGPGWRAISNIARTIRTVTISPEMQRMLDERRAAATTQGEEARKQIELWSDDPATIFGCPPLYDLWSSAPDFASKRSVSRRLGGWILIARSMMIVRHPSYPVDMAERRLNWTNLKIEEHGDPDDDWMQAYCSAYRREIEEFVSEVALFAPLDRGWDGEGMRPSMRAMYGEMVISLSGVPNGQKHAAEWRAAHPPQAIFD